MGHQPRTPLHSEALLDEADLVRRTRDFDQDALAYVYRTYHEAIYRYIYHHLGEEQEAQDLASEVFRRLLVALRADSGPREQMGAWLYRVAHNLVVDELRHRSRFVHQSLDDGLDELLSDTDQDPEEAVGHAMTRERIRVALTRLTPEQRQVIVLKFIEGMDNARVARITGKTVGAIKALQCRALEGLREQLAAGRRRAAVREAVRPAVAGNC